MFLSFDFHKSIQLLLSQQLLLSFFFALCHDYSMALNFFIYLQLSLSLLFEQLETSFGFFVVYFGWQLFRGGDVDVNVCIFKLFLLYLHISRINRPVAFRREILNLRRLEFSAGCLRSLNTLWRLQPLRLIRTLQIRLFFWLYSLWIVPIALLGKLIDPLL